MNTDNQNTNYNEATKMLMTIRNDYITIDARIHDMNDVNNLMKATMKLSVLMNIHAYINHVISIIEGLNELPYVIRTESHDEAIGITLIYQNDDYELSIECFIDDENHPINGDLIAIRDVNKLNGLLNDYKNELKTDSASKEYDYMVDSDFRNYERFISEIINKDLASFHETNALNHHYNDIPDL